MTSPKALYDYFEHNREFHPAIIFDLFGYENWTTFMIENKEETIQMFIGLFKGLYLMDISHKEIYRCFIKNKLDDLIHIKYSMRKNNYYREFCDKQIKIGKTFLVDDENENELEDDKCGEPYIYSIIQPPYHFNQKKTKVSQASLGTEDEIISYKINSYKMQDKIKLRNINSDYVTVNHVKKLLFKQDYKCYICGDNVLTEEWQPNCLYQFTLDRIDNNLPHDKNNVLICCLYCNCYGSDVNLYKLCKNKCHKIKRNITRTRENIPKAEIQKLIIK